MQQPFRLHHLFSLMEAYDKQTLPLDLFISHYFKEHKSLGSKDRAFIAEAAYGMIRWLSLLDFLSSDPRNWEKRYSLFENVNFDEVFAREDIPLYIRYSFPKHLFDLIVQSHGLQKALEICRISNAPAPTTVRVNRLKTTREAMLKRWKEIYDIKPCHYAENGITFLKKIAFFTLPEFKEGLFEVQDEGSQLLAQLVDVQPGQQVMDYCSGSGGKSLAFAPQMAGSGQIFLHDIRPWALDDAKLRLRRAGVQNGQVIRDDETAKLSKLKKKMHWVLVDAPCTGTGTMRRNPDMKWKFTEETLHRLVGQQRTIFEKALSYLRPDGRIVYGTCSILKEENDQQVEHFLKTYNLELEGNVMRSIPSEGGMDGFFGAVMRRKQD